jgi:hypothetical protein
MTRAAVLAENVLFSRLFVLEMNHHRYLPGFRLCPDGPGQNSVDQLYDVRLLKTKSGHEEHRCLYGIEKLLRPGGNEYPVKISSKTVSLCANNMASPATGNRDKRMALLQYWAAFHGKIRIFGRNQVVMGNQDPVCPGVAPVAIDTCPFFLIMGLVALQATRPACRGDDALQETNTTKDGYKLKTKAQFSPLINMATTVNTRMAAKSISVRTLISH